MKGKRVYPGQEVDPNAYAQPNQPYAQPNVQPTGYPVQTPQAQVMQPTTQPTIPMIPTTPMQPTNVPYQPPGQPFQPPTFAPPQQYNPVQPPAQPLAPPPTHPTTAPPTSPPTDLHASGHQHAGDQLSKHKRVIDPALDPEGQHADHSHGYGQPGATTGQLTNAMGNMSLGGQSSFTPAAGAPQGGIGSYATPAQPGTSVSQSSQGEWAPVSIAPSLQCPPLYMRMTIGAAPNSTNLINKSNIPFGCIVHPMARPTTDAERIPTVNLGVSGIIRCRRCRAYINPFVAFVEGGRRWRCNLCNLANDVPGEYFCPIDQTGRRTDLNERPELSKGCVEFIAPSEYMVRPPQPPSYFFVIDTSYYAITSGMFRTVVETIKAIINDFPGHPRTRIGFITYDSTVHFYNLKSSLSQPHMLVVTDINDIFLPLPDDMLVNLADSRAVVETLLNKLPNMFPPTQNAEAATGVALKAAFEVVKTIGGKILLLASTLPSLGAGKLKNREDLKLLGTDKEVQLMVPDDDYYKNFALDCSRYQVSVDLFLFSPQFTDVATLGCLPQFTGGQLYYYPAFRSDVDGERLFRDLTQNITRETGFEAVLRVRTSRGLKVTAHYGNFFIRSTDLLALPNVDADKAFGVQMALAESTIPYKYVSFQSALLYTTSSGERRIRVFTQCLPVVSTLADLFKFADVEAVTTLTAKMAIEKALTSKLSDAREALVNKCIDILSVYRTDVAAGASSATQLMLPESLKLFPLYVLALVKNILFRAGTDVRPDERTYYSMVVRTLPVGLTIPLIYPRMFALHNMPPEAGTVGADGGLVLPPTYNLSSEKLEAPGAFLLEDGQNMFLWLGKAISPEWLMEVFGLPSLDNVDLTQLKLPRVSTPLNGRVNAIIDSIRLQRPTFLNLYIVKQGDVREQKFYNYLVEDRTKSVHSYYEFLVNLHQRIQAKITRQ